MKLGKTATVTLQLLCDAYGPKVYLRRECLSGADDSCRVVVSVEDDTRSDWPLSSRNEVSVVHVRDAVWEGHYSAQVG